MQILKDNRYEVTAIALVAFGCWVLVIGVIGFGHFFLGLFDYLGGAALGVSIVMLAKILPGVADCPAWAKKFIATRLNILTER